MTVEQDHMAASDPGIFIKSGIKSSILFRHKVLLCLILNICQAASHDLFHFSIMYINTWSKFHLSFCPFFILHQVDKKHSLRNLPDSSQADKNIRFAIWVKRIFAIRFATCS